MCSFHPDLYWKDEWAALRDVTLQPQSCFRSKKNKSPDRKVFWDLLNSLIRAAVTFYIYLYLENLFLYHQQNRTGQKEVLHLLK